MKQWKKISGLLGIDMALVFISIYLAYYFRFDGAIPYPYLQQCLTFGVVSIVCCVFFLSLFRLYARVWRYVGAHELLPLAFSVTAGYALSVLLHLSVSDRAVPNSVLVVSFESSLLLVSGVRLVWKMRRTARLPGRSGKRLAIIVGAGDCGTLVAQKLLESRQSRMLPVGFVDDDPKKRGQRILGLPVLGSRSDIPAIVKSRQADDLILAMPSVDKKTIGTILDLCRRTNANVKIIPRIDDLIHGKVSIAQIRNVEVEDLLGRDPVRIDLEGVASYVSRKTVLVTGAGGSIGSELCRQLAQFQPERLLLLGHGENSIYAIEMELGRNHPHLQVEPIIADVQDAKRIDEVLGRYRPEVVFHAAAHKHVPLMEGNPSEAIKNNVLGTKNVADSAHRHGVRRFVLISTDKAVNPTSVMGVSKRIAEMYIQALDKQSGTKFVAVRFGNVLGSRGSVIPRFKEQIVAGGPVTVTHPDMVRYFMTIPEAVQLVIQAGAFAGGGEIFILDMGKPVRIVELAEDLIRLSGFDPYKDIDIQFTGVRPGEKLFEELLTNDEGITGTKHDRIFVGKPTNISLTDLEFSIKKLEKALGEDPGGIRELLKHIVPTYRNAS